MGQRCGLGMILKLIILSAMYSCSCSINCTRHNWSRADMWAASLGLIVRPLIIPVLCRTMFLKPSFLSHPPMHHPKACYPTTQAGRAGPLTCSVIDRRHIRSRSSCRHNGTSATKKTNDCDWCPPLSPSRNQTQQPTNQAAKLKPIITDSSSRYVAGPGLLQEEQLNLQLPGG